MVLGKAYNIEDLTGQRLKAKVTDGGKQYDIFVDFASEAGYPEATRFGVGSAYRLEGSEVCVLARGDPPDENVKIYVCQTKAGEKFLIGEDGIELIGSKLSELSTDELYKEIERRAFEAGYAEGKKAGVSSVTDVGLGIFDVASAVKSRDEIVEQAKADIAGLAYSTRKIKGPTYEAGAWSTVAEFIVNREKRTVVALMKGENSGRLRAKGIAKCDPDDCFNEHIGKAIALRRALGLDVPDEYLNAPAPKGVRVGDVVRGRHTRRVGDIDRVGEGEWGYGKYRNGDDLYVPSHHVDVIDDTARYQ